MESSLLGSCPHWRSHKNHTRSRSICRGNGSLQAVRGWLERNPFFPKVLPGNRETPHSQPSSLSARVKYTQARFCEVHASKVLWTSGTRLQENTMLKVVDRIFGCLLALAASKSILWTASRHWSSM